MTDGQSHPAPAAFGTIVELLRRRADDAPDQLLYRFLNEGEATPAELTHGELARRCRSLALTLRQAGLAGERALLVYPPGIDYIVAFFACLAAGVVAVPVYPPRPRRPMSRLLAIQASARARAALTTRATLARLDLASSDAALQWLATDELPPADADTWREPAIDGSDLAFLQYTSGSTAAPKGVMLTHANLLHNLELIRRTFAHGPHERGVLWLPPYHDMGLIGGILEPLYAGFPVTLMPPVAFLQRPLRWLEAISRERATVAGGPNFAYDLCVDKISPEERATLDLSCWELAFNGAEPVRAATLERFAAAFAPCGFRRQAFLPCYGLAESTLLVTGGRRGDGPRPRRLAAAALERHRVEESAADEGRELVGCGAAPDGLELVVVDPESRRPCRPDEVGEVWVRGRSVAAGYWGLPELTESTFGARLAGGRGPFLRTGDLGFLAADELFVTGRSKDLIIIRGRNHYPQDLEATAERSHPALLPGGAAVFALEPAAAGEDRLVVVQEVRRDQRNADPAPLVDAVRRALAEEHEVQVHAVVLILPATLPKTSSGKVQRHACRAAYLAGSLAQVASWRAEEGVAAGDQEPAGDEGDVGSWLAREVARRAGLDPGQVDPERPLASYPLDSLQAMELAHAIEGRLGVAVSMERFFADLTISELARGAAATPQGSPPLPPIQRHAEEVGEHPLSQGQLSLWFLHLLDPASPAYNVPVAVRLRGQVDLGALSRALELLAERHPALRTTFTTSRGEPRQRVHARVEIPFGVEDARGFSEATLAERLAEQANAPFDLAAGPLLRVHIFERSALDRVLLLTMHHIVTDFWSLGVLLDELAVLYPALAAGQRPALPAPSLAFSDYARWQAEMLAGPAGESLASYWQECLGGELPALELRTDRPRPRAPTSAGASHRQVIDRLLSAQLKELGRRHHATPFMTLLAAFQALLYRHTGQEDFPVGTVSAARSQAALGRVAGYFVNPLVMRADLAGDSSFVTLLARTRRAALGAFEHQDYPFPTLVERLQPERDPGRSPLFDVMFVLQRATLADGQDLTGFALGVERSRVHVGGLELEAVPLDQGIAQFDLTLTVGEVGGHFVANFDYNTRLFDAVTIELLAERFNRLLLAIVEEPERPVALLPLLTEHEERQVVYGWNDSRLEYPRNSTLADLIEEQARRTPDATALLFAGERRTYLELDRRASQVAHFLLAQGVGTESRVALCFERSIALIITTLGVLKVGAAYVPLDPSHPAERLAFTVQQSGACLVLAADHLVPQLAGCPRVINIDREIESIYSQRGEEPTRHGNADNLACIIYTSGSTGEPKGVELTHRSLVNMVSSFLHSYQPTAQDRMLPLTNVASASFVGEVFPLLVAGGALVVPEEREVLDVDALVALIERRSVSIASTVPAMMANLNALRDRLPRLRLILVGGEELGAGDVDKLLGQVEIVNGYGLTETAVCSTYHRLAAAELDTGMRLPIGKPVINTQIYVLDSHLRPLPIGAAGEIYVAGDGLARGYSGRPALTAQRFVPHLFEPGRRMFRTGDLGAWRPDGELEYLGRADRQVKLRGFRIELGEIEAALALHPAVKKAVVTVRPDGGAGGPRLVGYVIPETDAAPTSGELLAYLHAKLPNYMVPAVLIFLEALPLRPSGKVDIDRLPAPAAEHGPGESGASAPRSALERDIAAVWREVLGRERVSLEDNFFDLGGHSLLMAKAHARLKEVLDRELSLLELFQYPTIGSLARFLAGGSQAAPEVERRPARQAPDDGHTVAVVGLAGRFPGARHPAELWRNLVRGVEGIRTFSDEEMLAAGVAPELVANPNYIKAKGILGDVDRFDAAFFGLNPREVELMDPQHRLFLECCWEALEDAGYDGERYPGLVGVYGGASMNTYLLTNLLPHMELVASADTLQASLGNDKDPLTSRVAYKLNLKGPSITVQTASSTSLAAVHVAVKSLLSGDCDLALAGGVSIHLPETTGYLYQEGGTTSRDGHTRAFDADATGFVSGHGAGIVVLKRLADALADGDHIRALVRGSACNNDGSVKVSYMAPSVDGQMAVYRQAYADAGISPASVEYVECHGTGTALGDPIEITSLSQVYAAATDRRGFCAVGSLKTNIGHLDTAAGVCGLIKAVLALEHQAIPPSLHFERPNPRIDFAASAFFVNTELRPWPRRGGEPRRAAVTSLGMGGTNVHVVLEEAPPVAPPGPSRARQLLLLSAKSAPALDEVTHRLAAHLEQHPHLALPDVAFTLAAGRRPMSHRRMLLVGDRDEALLALAGAPGVRLRSAQVPPGDRPVAFLISGQGSQYPDMGRGLYEAEPSFRADVDRAAQLLRRHLELDLVQEMFLAADADPQVAAARLRATELAQPALFTIAWATARLWMRWGVRPRALLGHSLGEYVAAALAGVLSLEDALEVVAYRGLLMHQMPSGAMLAVPLAEEDTLPLLGEELSLAAVNRPTDCVVSGPVEAVDELEARLTAHGVACRRLHTSHAYHSHMMEPILRPFAERLRRVRLEPPRIPYLSNVTGTWIRPEEATDPDYWTRHLRQGVRFAAGVAELFAEPQRVLLEVGPGSTLASLAQQHPDRGPQHVILSSLRHPRENEPDLAFLLNSLGRLWLAGVEVDWAGYYRDEPRRRTPLPTYPFERQRYWVEPPARGAQARPRGRRSPDDWFHVPTWRQAPLPAAAHGPRAERGFLLFADPCGVAESLAARLRAGGQKAILVEAGGGLRQIEPERFSLAPHRAEELAGLLEHLEGGVPDRILHLWNVTGERQPSAGETLDRAFHGLLALAQELGRRQDAEVELVVVADGLAAITGDDRPAPLKNLLFGPCGVVPLESPHLTCRVVDLDLAAGGPEMAAAMLERELATRGGAPSVAYRGRRRWLPGFAPTPLASPPSGTPPLRPYGVYLVTGGLGGIGLALAEQLAREVRARLVLVGRSPLPAAEEWPAWAARGDDDPTARKVRRLLALGELGAEVAVFAADVADAAAMAAVKDAAEARFGSIQGVLHAAGVPGGALVAGHDRDAAAAVLRPKVEGLLVLEELFRDAPLDFLVSMSSLTAVLPEVGQSAYMAANAVLDAWAAARADDGGRFTAAINWDAWREVGMAVATEVPAELRAWRQESLAQGLATAEGVEAFRRVLAAGLPRVVVSTLDLESRRQEHDPRRLRERLAALEASAPSHARPELANAFVAPQSDLERQVATVWQEVLGIEQVGLNDNFFELGGNSLAGLRITRRLKERLAVDISDVSLYEAPTVGTLAELIARHDGAAPAGPGDEPLPAVVAAEPDGRSRGERRRARLQAKRGADSGEEP